MEQESKRLFCTPLNHSLSYKLMPGVIRVSFARLVNGSLLSSFTCFIGGSTADEPAAKKIRNGAAVVQVSKPV